MSTAVAVVAFAVAFGYVEAAVVVYLRSALGIVPAALPAHDSGTFGTLEALEIARELGTLVMITAVGWLAGRTRLERLAWAAVVFGAWDIVYYVGLWMAIGWPPSLDTWDVLFLVPVPWVGPVWAPLVVSAALVAAGLAAARRLTAIPHTGSMAIASPPSDEGSLVWASVFMATLRSAGLRSPPWIGRLRRT